MFFGLDQIWDSVMTIENLAHFTTGNCFVAMSDSGLPAEHLDLFVDSSHDFVSGLWIVAGNVVKDLSESVGRFLRPSYFCHESILSRTSESDRLLPSSESDKPR